MTENSNNDTKETSSEEMKNISENEDIQSNSDSKSEVKPEEVKQLEEKEHYELDYFSKEETLEKVKNLEKQLTEIKDKAQKLQKENNDSKNKYMHLQAEFENAQKRWNKSREDLRTQYTASVLKSFLPLYDSFKKAVSSANETEKNVLNGFYGQFMNIFKSYGAEPIEVKINDAFDYSLHEALTSVEKEDLPENSVVEIIQDGFKYGKEVIRYTKVVISRKPKPPPKPEPQEEAVEEVEAEESDSEDLEIEEESKEKKIKEKKSKKSKKDKENEKTA
ncbi:MAG: nucleotide exchange factor GrpE [Candidatus Hodarchaeota archaeon]